MVYKIVFALGNALVWGVAFYIYASSQINFTKRWSAIVFAIVFSIAGSLFGLLIQIPINWESVLEISALSIGVLCGLYLSAYLLTLW